MRSHGARMCVRVFVCYYIVRDSTNHRRTSIHPATNECVSTCTSAAAKSWNAREPIYEVWMRERARQYQSKKSYSNVVVASYVAFAFLLFFSLLFQLYFVFFLVPYRCVVRVSNSRHNRKSQTECMRFDLFGFDLWLSRRDQQHAAHTHRSQAEHTLTQEIELLYILFDSTNNSERRRRQWRRWKITHTRLNFNGIWFFFAALQNSNARIGNETYKNVFWILVGSAMVRLIKTILFHYFMEFTQIINYYSR